MVRALLLGLLRYHEDDRMDLADALEFAKRFAPPHSPRARRRINKHHAHSSKAHAAIPIPSTAQAHRAPLSRHGLPYSKSVPETQTPTEAHNADADADADMYQEWNLNCGVSYALNPPYDSQAPLSMRIRSKSLAFPKKFDLKPVLGGPKPKKEISVVGGKAALETPRAAAFPMT